MTKRELYRTSRDIIIKCEALYVTITVENADAICQELQEYYDVTNDLFNEWLTKEMAVPTRYKALDTRAQIIVDGLAAIGVEF